MMARWMALLALLMVLSALSALAGCATEGGPVVLSVPPGAYDAAFDAAVFTAMDAGFTPELGNRRQGVIETAPQISPSLAEPWALPRQTWDEAVENTVSMQRRWVRFEFSPVGDPPPPPRAREGGGPDLLALERELTNLTETGEPLELRVWVFVERVHRPGRRRSTWHRDLVSQAQIIDPVTDEPIESSFWMPVGRDERLGRRLLAEVQRRLDSSSSVEAAPSAEGPSAGVEPAPPPSTRLVGLE